MSNPYLPPGAGLSEAAPTTHARRVPIYSLACSILAALLCSLVVPNFREAFVSYGAELPLLTRIVFAVPHAVWLLPVLVVAAWRSLHGRVGLQVARVVGIGGPLLLGPLILIAIYLPIFRLAATVG
jgi:type II secretory pathway component PulF